METMSEKNLKLRFDADGGSYFILLLKNMFLTIITLGIYYFWANVNIQRFFTEHFTIQDNRFGYHATGKERFIGFLKGLGVLLVLAGIFYLLAMIHPVVPVLIYVPAFFLLLPALTVARMRYQLSRTSYANIRFRFKGSARELFFIFLKGIPLMIVTLGIYYFWFEAELYRFYARNTAIGTSHFQYTGTGKDVFLITLKGILLSIITLGIYYAWFFAARTRYVIQHTSFQDTPLTCDLEGGATFAAFIVNYLLMLITLFIATPWAIINVVRTITESIGLGAEIRMEELSQQVDEGANAFADGVNDAFSFLDVLAEFIS